MGKITKSEENFKKASSLIPGGVNSPVRAFNSVGGTPRFIEKGEGPWLIDVDGNRYIDYMMSWGPMILGHSNPEVIKAIKEKAGSGTSFGAATQAEIELAEIVASRIPAVEKVRMVSSGTEACMTAVRLARAFTGRDYVIKFEGGYHGHADPFLIKAGSGLVTGGLPGSAGIPKETSQYTVCLPYNDVESIEKCFKNFQGKIAAVIVEPVAANMGVIPPAAGFLEKLRDITSAEGSLLIFDEVITGFRVAMGGAGELYGVKPDLVCMGKILGGGLPAGGVGGRADIMDRLAPVGDVYQAGTLSGNPLAVASGIATLNELDSKRPYEELEWYGTLLEQNLTKLFERKGVPTQINRVGSILTVFFTKDPVTDFESAKMTDTKFFGRLFTELLVEGVYLPPSAFEAWFLSLCHIEEIIEMTVEKVEFALARI